MKNFFNIHTQHTPLTSLVFPSVLVFVSGAMFYLSLFAGQTELLGISLQNLLVWGCILVPIVYWALPKHELFLKAFRWLITPAAILIGLAMRCADLLIYPNFSFTYFHIDPTSFSLLTAFLGFVFLTTLSLTALRKKTGPLTFVLGLVATHILLLRWIDFHAYDVLTNEDGVYEYMQFVSYSAGSVWFFLTAHQVAQQHRISFLARLKALFHFNGAHNATSHMLLAYLLIASAGFFFIAGEEISWGQRIFNFETPAAVAQKNTQYEFNLHNNHVIFPHVYQIYGMIAIFALLSPLLFVNRRYFSDKLQRLVSLMTFRWYHIPYFVPMVIYVAYRVYYDTTYYDVWEEAVEVLFAFGMLLFAVQTWGLVRMDNK